MANLLATLMAKIDDKFDEFCREQSTHGPASAMQSTHGPDTITQSTHGPASAMQSTHGPATITQSTHGPDTITQSTHGPASAMQSTHGPATITQSTHGPDTITQSTHGPDMITQSTHGPATITQSYTPLMVSCLSYQPHGCHQMCCISQQMQVVSHMGLSWGLHGGRVSFPLHGIPSIFPSKNSYRLYWPSGAGGQYGLINVLFLSDNTAVVAVINRQTAKDPQLMSLLRQLILHACLIIYVSRPSTSLVRSMLFPILSRGCRSHAQAPFSPAWTTNQHQFPFIGYPGTQRPEYHECCLCSKQCQTLRE